MKTQQNFNISRCKLFLPKFCRWSNEKIFAKKWDFGWLYKKYEIFSLKFLHISRVFVQKVAFLRNFCLFFAISEALFTKLFHVR